MTCSHVKINGNAVILCGRGQVQACIVCGSIATTLCDWKVGKNGKTCDAPMCDTHAINVGKNRDLCFVHNNAWRVHPANKQMALAL